MIIGGKRRTTQDCSWSGAVLSLACGELTRQRNPHEALPNLQRYPIVYPPLKRVNHTVCCVGAGRKTVATFLPEVADVLPVK